MPRPPDQLFPAEEPEPVRGLRPLQIVCLIGFFASIALALVAFEDVSIELVVLGMGFAAIIALNAIWRGITTGKLQYRHQIISSDSEPGSFTFLLLFYTSMVIALIYFGVDLLLIEL